MQELQAPDHNSRISLSHRHSLAETAAGTYNLAVASSILEHVPSPQPELVGLLSALAPAGVFFARTPWIVPILQIYERVGLNFDFTYPAHVHDLGRDFWQNILARLPVANPDLYKLRHSGPSPVETTLREAPLRTAAAHSLKAIWRIFPTWRFVGGWEVLFERSPG